MTNLLLKSALFYATEFGWHVFPVKPGGKSPLTKHGFKDATTERQQIKKWWKRWPNANIGVACGPSGLLVLDIDGKKAYRELEKLERESGFLPETLTVQTAKGEHRYFDPGDHCLKSTAGKLAPGLDTRGVGGYVVVPPSVHPSGRRYTWDEPPDAVEIAPVPDWLVELMIADRHRTRSPRSGKSRNSKIGDAMIPKGRRNTTIAQMAGILLYRYVDPLDVLEMCQIANEDLCDPPLPSREVERIVNSICGSELRRRRGH